MNPESFQSCIDECNSCATMCNYCSISCLHQPEAQNMIGCIEMNLQCAAICRAAAEMMTLGSKYAPQICAICAEICDACRIECGKQTMLYCLDCADECKRCASACHEMSMTYVPAQ